MSERTPRHRRRPLILALAPLVSLSGCLTENLWKGYAWPDPVVTDRRIARRTELVAGSLVESQPVLENGLWWCDDRDATPWRWWLGARPGAGADFAAALLGAPDFCEVLAASIDAHRSRVDEEVLDDEAVLELDLRLRAGAIGEVVPATEVPPAAAHVLAPVRRNAYVLTADPGASLPVVFCRCAERLRGVDLRGLVDEPGEECVEAWVFVDADGRPAFGADSGDTALPAAAYDDEAPLADRLEALRQLSLLVRVRSGAESTVLRLRPDRLWLFSGLRAEGDRFTHRSHWHLQRQPLSVAAPPAFDALRIAATLRLQQDEYQRTIQPVLIDNGLLARVALTPLTLALDVVLNVAFGPGAGDFWEWVAGNRPHHADRPRRGR